MKPLSVLDRGLAASFGPHYKSVSVLQGSSISLCEPPCYNICVSRSPAYSFMILNMFLAFAALELSFLLPLFKAKSKRELPVSIAFYIVFVLLSPNVFYVITDLIHLNMF